MAKSIIIDCERCGQPFCVVPSRAKTARYCSRKCFITKKDPKPCAICGGPLREVVRRNKNTRFCSDKCKGVFTSQNGAFHPPPEKRFWAKIDKAPGHGPKGDCWLWTGTLDEDGYGRFRIDGKKVGIHKFSYKLHKGDVPRGMCVCHSCDVRKCGNPAHLWLGDSPANTADMYAKGRGRYFVGEDCPVSKLTEEQALSILRDDRPQYVIADEYGLSRANVCLIKQRKTWKHLTP